jgi:hypothetical protein
MRCCLLLVVAATTLFGGVSAAENLKSGPQPPDGLIPGPFHPINVNGEHKGNAHCLVCEYGLDPVVLVFAHDGNKPLERLLQRLDAAVEKHQGTRLHAAAVLLNEDYAKEDPRRKLIADAEQFAAQAGLKRVGVAVYDADGPKDYNLNRDAGVTVLLYRKHKVLANYAFPKDGLKDADVSAIAAAAQKLATAR